MSMFRPKDIFRQARRAEKLGKSKEAASKYAKLGVFLLDREKYDDAHLLLRRSIRLSPMSCRPIAFLALCEKFQNRPEDALQSIRRFTRCASRQKKLDHYRGFVERLYEKHPKLREIYYESVLEIDRTSVNWFFGLARAQMQAGENIKARKTLLEAFQTRGDDEKCMELLIPVLQKIGKVEHVHYLRRYQQGKLPRDELLVLISDVDASASLSQSQANESLTSLIEALEDELGIELEDGRDNVNVLLNEFRVQAEPILKQSPQARLDMALAYREMGLTDVAMEEIRAIPEQSELALDAEFLKGQINFDEGADLAALDAFQKCLRKAAPGSEICIESLYKLVHVYRRLGDVKQAWVSSKKLGEFDPRYRDNPRIIKEIETELGLGKVKRRA